MRPPLAEQRGAPDTVWRRDDGCYDHGTVQDSAINGERSPTRLEDWYLQEAARQDFHYACN